LAFVSFVFFVSFVSFVFFVFFVFFVVQSLLVLAAEGREHGSWRLRKT
jgi:hypothetical protein